MVRLSYLMSQRRHTIRNWSPYLTPIPRFFPNVFYAFQNPIQDTTLHVIFWAATGSQTFPNFDNLDSFEDTGQVFCRMFLDWNLPAHRIRGTCHPHDLSAKVVLTSKVTPLPYCALRKEATKHSLHLRREGFSSISSIWNSSRQPVSVPCF